MQLIHRLFDILYTCPRCGFKTFLPTVMDAHKRTCKGA